MDKIKGFFYITHRAEVSRYDASLPQRLILESNPDIYYHDKSLPEELATPSDHHLFALTKGCGCFQERVYRNLIFFEQQKQREIHIYPGFITLSGLQTMILRFREAEFELAMEFFDLLEDREGIGFLRDKKVSRQTAVIHFEKYVELEELFDGIYREIDARNVYFIELPVPIVLEEFCEIARRVSYTCKFASFEPYCAYQIASNREIRYFFMFYSKNCKLSNLPDFKQQIIREITRLK